MATEKYEKPVRARKLDEHKKIFKNFKRDQIERFIIDRDKAALKDPLGGGLPCDAISLLTGKKSQIITRDRKTQKMMEYSKRNSLSSISVDRSKNLDSLDKIRRNPTRYAAAVSFKNDDEAKDIYTKHCYMIKRVGRNKVILVNPWDSSKEDVITRKEFLSNFRELNVCDMESKTFGKNP